MTTAIDLAAVKQRQRATLASGDYGSVAAMIHPMSELLVTAADLPAGARVLDVATGTGNAAIAAARCGCQVTGVDYVPALLESGKRRSIAEGYDITFEVADVEALPYAMGSFDVVLSTYANHMTHGFHCASDLVSIARHYVLTAELIEHYRLQASPNLLAVRYEDLIDDQETWVRRMLAFVGAPYDALCLSFHENRRYARTASYAQVTEKLYDRSRCRYRAYLKHLKPVIPILEPVIKRLGYTID